MYTSVNKYSKSQPKAGTYLLKTGSNMKTVSNYVPALRTMQQDKTAANPNPPKTNQHEENCYKLDGYKSNHYRKHYSRIIQSVRKFLLTTNAKNCFKLLSKFPDCTLQVLNLSVAQYPPRCYCIVHCIDLFNSEWNNGFVTNWSWKYTKFHVVSYNRTIKATTSCYYIFFSVFSIK